jgi:hypothetical protein
MTTAVIPTEQIADIARRGQEAATAAAQAWTGALRTYADAVTPRGARPVDPQAAVAATFDLAEQLLGTQRELAATTLTLLSEAAETVTAQASAAGDDLKARTEQATERVIDLATETTRRAATGARNGVSV